MTDAVILALDSSGPACSAALWRVGRVEALCAVNNGNTHSVNLMGLVEHALSGTPVSALSAIACVTGPGSFTGVRIGVSAARALAFAHGIPCIGVNALEALALACPAPGAVVCPVLDARRSQAYCAAFRDGQRLLQDAAMDICELAARLAAFEQPCIFTGDGVAAFEGTLRELLGDKARFAPAAGRYVSAGAAAELAARAFERGEAVAADALEPYYLRAPQAEREYAARHGGGTGDGK